MEFRELTPMLSTGNIKESVAFYTTVLGFRCDELNEEWGWAEVSRDRVAIMFSLPNAHRPFDKPVFTGSLYIYTDDVDGLWEQLKDKVEVCYPIDNFGHGMREFAIYDNNGYLLQFGKSRVETDAS